MSEAKALRAYSVQGYESGCVIFASSHVEARRLGANEIDHEFESIESCKLAPEFDQYCPGPVPVRALLEHDWRFGCYGCSRIIYGMEVEDDETGECHEPIFHGDGVFCTSDCRDSDIRGREERKAAKEKLLNTFAKHFPDCTVEHTWGVPVPNALKFNFPGGRYGGRWEIDDPHKVNISAIDLPAWETYRDVNVIARWEGEGGRPVSR